MIRHKIDKEKEEDGIKELYWQLSVDCKGELILECSLKPNCDYKYGIMGITPAGAFIRYSSIISDTGLQLDKNGCIMEHK